MRAALPLVLAGALLTAGCGGDDDELGASSFSAELTGAYVETVTGEASYGIARSGDLTGFTLVLGDGGTSRVQLTTSGDSRPAEGTYEIVAPDDPEPEGRFRGDVGYVTGGALLDFEIRGGSITITSSEPGAVAGTFTLRAVQTSPCCFPEPIEIFLDGSFDARAL
jgi:hypothetical protein